MSFRRAVVASDVRLDKNAGLSGRVCGVKAGALKHHVCVEAPREDDLFEGCLDLRSPLSLDSRPRGHLVRAEEDGVESPPPAHLRWASLPVELLVELTPGRVVKRVDRALLIELQAGDDVGPVGDASEIVGLTSRNGQNRTLRAAWRVNSIGRRHVAIHASERIYGTSRSPR